MFCPECEAEFRDGFTMCSDCGVPLVDSLPTEMVKPVASDVLLREPKYRLDRMMDDGVLVYEGGVDLKKGINKIWLVDDLEEKQIPYFIEFYPLTRGNVGIYVSEADSGYALGLVKQYKESPPVITPEFIAEDIDGYDENIDKLPQVVCPSCGKSHDLDWPKCPFCDYEYET